MLRAAQRPSRCSDITHFNKSKSICHQATSYLPFLTACSSHLKAPIKLTLPTCQITYYHLITMPYNNLNRSKGMLQSSHAPHMQAASRSSVGLLNPAAGSFNPQAFTNRSTRDTFASSQPYNSPNEDTSTAVVPHEPQHEGKEQITVRASELHQLTDLFNEEILSLRKDIEMLKQGGWTVTVGAFQPPKQIDLSQVEATRQRLQNSCGLLGALKSHAHFFSPATAKTQIEGPPSPPLTPVRASAIGTSPNAPKAESVCQNQDQTRLVV